MISIYFRTSLVGSFSVFLLVTDYVFQNEFLYYRDLLIIYFGIQ